MQCVGQVEIDPFCQDVLAKHWPNVKRIGDIREVKGDEFGTVDLVCGGFPCQPFSSAGKRKGKADDRYLWPEMLRVIQAYRPTWVLGENVAGIVNMALDTVLSDLETQGYQCEAFIIPACAVDAKHERKRVYIVARRRCANVDDSEGWGCRFRNSPHFGQNERNVNAFTDPGSPMAHSALRKNDRRESGVVAEAERCGKSFDTASIACGQNVPYSHSAGCGERRRTESIQLEQYPAQCLGQAVSHTVNDGRNRTEGNEAEQGSDEPDNWIFERGHTWEPEPGVGRVAHGVPGRVDRLRSLGNAVVPQVVEVIGRAIMATERAASMPQEIGPKDNIETCNTSCNT